MKQIGYTQDSHPCSTFEPRHPCLGYANLQQRQRRLRRGIGAILPQQCCLILLIYLQTYTYFPRHRRNCDLPSPGWRGRAYEDVFATTSLFNGQLTIPGSRSKACCYATLAMSQAHLCESAPQVIGCCLTTLFAPTAFGDIKGEIGATLLVLSRLKHMKCPQTYTSFPGTGETVTVENRDVFVEATWTYSRRVTGSSVRKAHRR